MKAANMSWKSKEKLPPHVVIFPFPALGHMNCMLNLAHLFCLADFHVTFIVSEFSHRRLLKNATLAAYPGFQFRDLPDGLPDDHPRSGAKVDDLVPAVTDTMIPLFKRMMAEEALLASANRRPATCFVADIFHGFAADSRKRTASPCSLSELLAPPTSGLLFISTTSFKLKKFPSPVINLSSFYIHLFNVRILSSKIQFSPYIDLYCAFSISAEKSMDGLVKGIRGMEGYLRRRDLPGFFRTDDVNNPLLQSIAAKRRQAQRTQALILNTFQDLEGPILSIMLEKLPRIYTIGPIHEQHKSKFIEKEAEASIVAGNFWA